MHLRADLPSTPRRTKWHVRVKADGSLTLQLRRTGLHGRRAPLASWTAPDVSALAPDPASGLRHVAEGLLESVSQPELGAPTARR